MRLTERTDYALRVLMFLAACRRQATVSEMAERFDVSHHHLVKVVQTLGEMGLVRTTRGRGGGVLLEVDPSTVRLGDVVSQTEPDLDLVECMRADGNCPLAGPCVLEGFLSVARAAFIDVLNESTLADLAGPRRPLLRSLGLPATEIRS